MDLESSLVRVPFESLKRTTRERKYVVEELETLQKGIAALAAQAVAAAAQQQGGSSGGGGSSGEQPGTFSREAALAQLEAYMAQLQGLKSKLEATGLLEQAEAGRVKARLDHLAELGPPPKEQHIEWNRRRVDRLLVDHMLRGDHQRSAAALSAKAGIGPLADTHIFQGAQRVVEALRSHDAGPALAWCEEHRSRLRKARSGLELQLRVQEFVELVRAERMLDAIAYARRHLAPWAPTHLPQLQRCAALLAFTAETTCPRYLELLDKARWGDLVVLFHRELYRLNLLPPMSLLSIHLQAGLCALKTPQSLGEECSKEDPLHLPAFRKLAEGLPYAKHAHSKLICAISRSVMDDNNPPMALPNGHVYSQAALRAMAAASDGRVTCPRTGFACEYSELRRVYVV